MGGHSRRNSQRIGVIGQIDKTLNDFQLQKTSNQKCIKRLIALFEVINQSPQKEDLIRALIHYIDSKYGENFPWDDFPINFPENAILPQIHRAHRRDEDN